MQKKKKYLKKIIFHCQQQVWRVILHACRPKWCVCGHFIYYFVQIPHLTPASLAERLLSSTPSSSLSLLCLLFPRWSLIPRLLQTEPPAEQTDAIGPGPAVGGTDLARSRSGRDRVFFAGTLLRKEEVDFVDGLIILFFHTQHTAELQERWIRSSCCRSSPRWSPESHLGWNLSCTVGSALLFLFVCLFVFPLDGLSSHSANYLFFSSVLCVME